MARPTILERAGKYVDVMPAAISGSEGHNATYAVACALVKGFNLTVDQARPIMSSFNQRCSPPWTDKELEHKLNQANKTADPQPRGYLLGEHAGPLGTSSGPAERRPSYVPPKPKYDPELLKRTAGKMQTKVDLIYLANRSILDPAQVTAEQFLKTVFRPGEKALVFNHIDGRGNACTQGEALWPDEKLPTTGKAGVWWLIQPVDGLYHPNPRSEKNKTSRRSEESVTRWPYMILESDDAPVLQWMAVLVQLPLQIVAIYSSGGRSVHALVRVDAVTKLHWDAIVKGDDLSQSESMAAGMRALILNGADRGVLSAVRLSRLPGCHREGKMGEERYERFPKPQLQKLLYLNPEPEVRPIADMLERRDVVEKWTGFASNGISDADDDGGRWLFDGLAYYEPVSPTVRQALQDLRRVHAR